MTRIGLVLLIILISVEISLAGFSYHPLWMHEAFWLVGVGTGYLMRTAEKK